MRDYAVECVLAYGADLCLGDPRWVPHPVQGIGRWIDFLERRLNHGKHRCLRGVSLWILTVVPVMAIVALMLFLAERVGGWMGLAISVGLLYLAFATRSLMDHGNEVARALRVNDLPAARTALSRMVARDTGNLDVSEIARGCIESLAENFVDGSLSPLLFAFFGGPIAAWGLKAISTLDSMVGYRNQRFRDFGWASARSDDVAQYLPARLTWILLPVSSMFVGARAGGCLRVMARDGDKNPSPNSGLPEAGVAGALDLELGGINVYQGAVVEKPRLNAGAPQCQLADIARAQSMVFAATVIAVVLMVAVHFL